MIKKVISINHLLKALTEHVHCAVHTTYAHSWELIKKVISINNLLKALTQNVTSVNH